MEPLLCARHWDRPWRRSDLAGKCLPCVVLPCQSREGRGDKHQVVLSAVMEINRKMQWCGWVGQQRLLLFFNINFFGCAASYSTWEPQASLWPMGSFAVALVEACGLLFPDQELNPGPMPGAQNLSCCTARAVPCPCHCPVPLLVTPWTIAHQFPLSVGFPSAEHWHGCCSFPSPGIFLTQGSNPSARHWQVDLLPPGRLGSPRAEQKLQ